ncbi:protein of unknown function (DUF4779) [Popillia japonica]|uniref:Uncharacterized protein n=1 Tax=Popillia japonica TaxID=7064 RepID=A0AAW1JKJ6_POPJA
MSIKFTAISLIVVWIGVNSTPIIIKTGIAKDHSQEQGGGVYDVSSNKGISSYEADQGFNKDKEGKHVSAQDSGQYVQELADNKQHLEENNYNRENFQKLGGGSVENVGKQAGHKKGHHKSGFKNSYHKEESGSKSSYYDDSDDQGGEYFLNSKQGAYTDDNASVQRGSSSDGSKYVKDDSRRGAYDNQGLYHKDFGTNQNYDQQKYQDNRANQGRSNQGNRFGESGRYVSEKYHSPPHYAHEDYYYPEDHYYADYSSPKRTITVYEDPRVYEAGSQYSEYDDYPEYSKYDDSVHLLVKRPVERRYYDEDNVYKHGYY